VEARSMIIKKILKIGAIVFGVLIIIIAAILVVKSFEVKKGKVLAEQEYKDAQYPKLSFNGSIKRLSILPLIDFYTDSSQLKTEAGVSYLVKADDTVILFDVGYNAKNEHPSPLLHNMKMLGKRTIDIGMIFISHLHLDHVGGMENLRAKTFSLSRGAVDLKSIDAFTPEPMVASSWNPKTVIRVIQQPVRIKPGIASMGGIPRHLFLIGKVYEQSLAVNLQGKGIAIIIGCGHPTVERIVERAAMLFSEPIYAIVGGLHYPLHGGRGMMGLIQYIVAKDSPPWSGLNDADLDSAIQTIKKVNPVHFVLSPHDSSDAAIARFKESFDKKFAVIKVGEEIRF
jgi:7,8-dihydropterin-6-yl-methyl-4-(beta-D-ribofuranosyl)aminobenzene 5'-phosphate synthase